jgi:hypothetical protein
VLGRRRIFFLKNQDLSLLKKQKNTKAKRGADRLYKGEGGSFFFADGK